VWELGATAVATRVADRFDEAGIDYAIGGAIAMSSMRSSAVV
jgi:hypothetical protein